MQRSAKREKLDMKEINDRSPTQGILTRVLNNEIMEFIIYLLGSSNVDVSFGSAGRDALDDLGEVLLDEVDISMEAGLVALVTYRIQDVEYVHPCIE